MFDASGNLAIEAKGLVKVFGDKRAVDGVDLSVERGSVYGVLVGAFDIISAARNDDGKGATYAFAPLTRRFVTAPLKQAA